MHTENQLPRLPGSALKVPAWVVVGSYQLSSQAPTHVEVELGCDNYYEIIKCSVNGFPCETSRGNGKSHGVIFSFMDVHFTDLLSHLEQKNIL